MFRTNLQLLHAQLHSTGHARYSSLLKNFATYIVYYAEAAQSKNYTGKYRNIHAYMLK